MATHTSTAGRFPRIRLLGLVAVLVAWAAPAPAQTVYNSAYVEGGVLLSHQIGPTGDEYLTYVTAPGGSTVGWLAGGGVHLTRWLTAVGEFASTGMMTANEPSRYNITYHEERRDRFLTLGFSVPVPLGPYLAFEPMAGLVVTFPQAWSQAQPTSIDQLPSQSAQPRVTHLLDTAVGPAFGASLRIGRGHVTLVPSFRLLRTAVTSGKYDDSAGSPDTEIGSIYPGGYPEWTERAALALRIAF